MRFIHEGTTMIEVLLSSNEFKKLIKANDFNLLSLFSDLFSENSYSRLLAYLFDSEENHGLHQQFFRAWVKNAEKIKFKLPTAKKCTIKTSFNWRTHENRFIDLIIQVIENSSGRVTHVIGIENKKFTSDSEKQLSDYQLDIISTFPQAEKILIFLTPKGHSGKSQKKLPKCPCVSLSYESLINTCEQKFKTKNHDILILIKNLNTFIRYNLVFGGDVGESKKNIVTSISKNPEYKDAIKEIIKYCPIYKTIRNLIYEDVIAELQDIFDYARVAWVYPKTSNTPHEINFEINDLNDLVGKRKIEFYYMICSNTPNPHINDEICVRLMAYCSDNYEYVKSSQVLSKKIKKANLFPNNISAPKQWKPWECLYSGQNYKLSDMGALDTESIVEIIQDCVEQTYEPLKEYLSQK